MSSNPFSLKCLPPTRRGSDIPLFDDLVEFTVGELGLDLPLEPPEGGDVGDVSGFVSRTGSASEDADDATIPREDPRSRLLVILLSSLATGSPSLLITAFQESMERMRPPIALRATISPRYWLDFVRVMPVLGWTGGGRATYARVRTATYPPFLRRR